jgi:uncharacterized protein
VTAGALPDDWTLPRLDQFNATWFTSGRLTVQTCSDCGTRQHPPEELCHRCGSMTTLGHTELDPTGVVHSYTVAHYPVNRALANSVPYAVVLVALSEDPAIRIVGNVLDVDPADIHIGMPVTATWVERSDDDGTVQLIQWLPA